MARYTEDISDSDQLHVRSESGLGRQRWSSMSSLPMVYRQLISIPINLYLRSIPDFFLIKFEGG